MSRKLTDLFVFSNFYVAIPVTCLAVVSSIIFNVQANLYLLGFIYCSTLSLYAFHRYWGLKKISETGRSERHEWAFKNRSFLLTTVVIALLGSASLLCFLPITIWLALTPLALLSLGYTLPVITTGAIAKRLRDVPSIKIYLISMVVGSVVVLLPAIDAGLVINDFTPLFIAQCFFLFGITIPFDIRDMYVDDQELRTIPIVFGERKAKWIAILSLFVSAIIAGIYIERSIGFIIAVAVASIVVGFVNSRRSEYYFSLLVEGTMIIQLLLVWMEHKLW